VDVRAGVVTAVDELVLSIGKVGPGNADADEPITYTLTVIGTKVYLPIVLRD
jgi:hypothetical protein